MCIGKFVSITENCNTSKLEFYTELHFTKPKGIYSLKTNTSNKRAESSDSLTYNFFPNKFS